jgi:hypothetical protein
MADASNVRHDTIVVPETMSPAQVRALAQRKAQAQVGDDGVVSFVHLHGSVPVGGEHGTEVEWRYSYQGIPPGGAAAAGVTAGDQRVFPGQQVAADGVVHLVARLIRHI